MALPFFDSAIGRKRDLVMGVDLGSRTTKAVCVARRSSGFALTGFALLDAPIYEKSLPPDLLGEHLKAVNQALQSPTRYISLTVGVNDAHVRHADLPRMPIPDMRQVLKLSSKSYLQQDLPGHVFDCHLCAPDRHAKANDRSRDQGGPPKQRVLVAGARKQLLEDMVEGAKNAGLVIDCVIPGLVSPVNSFEKTLPEVFAKEAVALVDLGFKNSSICIVQEGQLMLSRVVGIGGDRMTNSLAEHLGIGYAEADGIKIGMPGEVEPQLDSLLVPLGRELRASIDFFEHQHDRPVTQVFVTGGAARSEFILQRLHRELMVECGILNPVGALQLELPPQQSADIEHLAPQLAVALGAALAAL
jgi:type IV pilus assembly protein PilM